VKNIEASPPLRLFALLAGLVALASGAQVQATETPLSTWWSRLEVRSLEGRALPPPSRWMVVVFLDPECPVANGYVPVINALATEFGPVGFVFLGAYVDSTANLARLRSHVREFGVAFPTVDDRAQRLARFTGASYGSEAMVLDAAGKLLYRGRIDDRVGENGAARPAATRYDLREVLQRLGRGEAGPFTAVPGFGCALASSVKRP
jgi:hypothetical protein